jgi:hypothetical protein
LCCKLYKNYNEINDSATPLTQQLPPINLEEEIDMASKKYALNLAHRLSKVRVFKIAGSEIIKSK